MHCFDSRIGRSACVLLSIVAGIILATSTASAGLLHSTVIGDTTFTVTGSPYTISDTLVVADGATIVIEPGVVVRMVAGAALVVLGDIDCVGTAGQMITFEPVPGEWYWSAVALIGTDTTAEVRYTSFRMGDRGTFEGNHLRGTLTAIDSDVQVTDCRFHDAHKHGVSIADCSGLVARNRFTQIVGEPIDINDSSCDVIDNEIIRARGDAIDYNNSFDNPLIAGNLIDGGDDDGLDLDTFVGTAANNTIIDCSDKGISASVYSDVIIENNVITGCFMGLGITAGSIARIHNNTLARNQYGIRAYEKIPGAGGATIIGKNMLVWDNVTSILLDGLSTVTLTYSDVEGSSTLPGEGNINLDPMFVNPASDLHLQEGSPCIDAGFGDPSMPPLDFEGDMRADDPTIPNTGGGQWPWFDIGADELMPSTVAVEQATVPAPPALLSVRPNPVEGPGRVQLAVPVQGRGELRLFDVGGRLLRHWPGLAAPLTVDWDGRDAGGQRLADGVYFLAFTPSEPLDSPVLTARVVLVRGQR